MKKTFKIKGMHCNSCSQTIENALKDKVDNISVSYSKGHAIIEFDPNKISETSIQSKIRELGYDVEKTSPEEETKKKPINVGMIVLLTSSLLLIYVIYNLFGSMDVGLPDLGQKTSLILLFLAGLLTGFHCVAMCGGFIVSYTAKNAQEGHKSFFQHIVYGGSKIVSYTIIGALFGLIGSIFIFSPALRGGIAIFAGVFMIFFSLSMFGFGFFRRFQFNPKFLTKISSKKYKGVYFGPAVTGLLNGLFLACGPLQALYIYAAGTGSMIEGATSLAAFGLGTLPIMLGFGGVANIISHKATKKILKLSGVIVLILGLVMLNRGLALTGTGYDYNSIVSAAKGVEGIDAQIIIDDSGAQVINMEVNRYGWSPDSFVLKKGVPVKWVINGKEINGCNNAIQVPKLGLKFDIRKGEQVIEFTPNEEGVIPWSCWMGMIPGSFIVTDTGEATQEQLDSAQQQAADSGGSCGMGAGGGGCGCGG